MSDTLRDQLLGLGFKPAPKPERPAKPAQHAGRPQQAGKPQHAGKPQRGPHKPQQGKPQHGQRKPRTAEEIDLAKAFALRAQTEKAERIAAEAAKQEAARIKREAKAKVDALLQGAALNDDAADIARHFEYGSKIRRVYVTAEQLKALNAGELAVVQLNGRYLLVTVAIAEQVAELLPSLIALRVDPNAPASDDPYSDPQYQVPDDLVW